MAQLIFAPRAIRDLAQLQDYIAGDNPEAADRWIAYLEEQCNLLASHPRMGVRRPSFGVGIRVWPVRDYLILYRETRSEIRIAHIVSSKQEIRRRLRRQ